MRKRISKLPYDERLSEHSLKNVLDARLRADGWTTKVAWHKIRGIDIEARRGETRWVLEVKGMGTRNAMRVNYFLAILGETLQRMDDSTTKYSIALPDLPQFAGFGIGCRR
jgi:hypothetical protein